MKQILYAAGRVLQVFALVFMPSSIWVGQFQRNETAAISIFLGSLALFFLGYFLTAASAKL